MTRRQLLRFSAGAAISASGSGLYATTIEPRWFDVSHTVIRLPKLRRRFRALHLADLHCSSSVPTELLLDAVRTGIAMKPDAIFLTGDYVSTLRRYDEAGLKEIFGKLAAAAPAFAVMGNHDAEGGYRGATDHMRRLLADQGVNVLHNASTTVSVKGQEIALAGVGDLWNHKEFRPHEAFANVMGEIPAIALIHNPDAKDAVSHYPWDLMLSGHTHGGQVVFPFVHPYWLPVYDQRFIAGLYRWDQGRQIYITRGVGSPTGIRFRCRPEISVLEFEPTPPATL